MNSLIQIMICGLCGGLSALIFQKSLQWANETRIDHPLFIWTLPLSGLVIGFGYRQFKSSYLGTKLFLASTLTHLSGGSAGREGVVVQLGIHLANRTYTWLSRMLRINSNFTHQLMISAGGASFGATIGAPIAGALFGIEFSREPATLRLFLHSFLSSLVAYFISLILGIDHFQFSQVHISTFEVSLWVGAIIAGVFFGFAAQAYSTFHHQVRLFFYKFFPKHELHPLWGGLVLLLLFQIPDTSIYSGLGTETILASFQKNESFLAPFWKIFFTGITLGSGFKGGEFIPLIFIGVTLGSALTPFFTALPLGFLPSLGFGAVFGAVSTLPFTSTVLIIELFGISLGPYALVTCLISSWLGKNRYEHKKLKLH